MTMIYFAHSKRLYGGEVEENVLDWIRTAFKGYDILNPALYEIEEGYKDYFKEMFEFYKLIDTCELMIVMGNTDGVMKERIYALEHNISVIEVPSSVSGMDTYL